MQLLFLPMLALNLLAGIVGGIWLLFYGQWGLVIAAIIRNIVSPYFLSLLIAPSLIFSIPIVRLNEGEHPLYVFILCMLSLVWTYLVLAAWCVLILSIALTLSHEHGMYLNYYIPYMLLAYSVATSPLKELAIADERIGISESGIAVGFFCITSAIVLFLGWVGIMLSELIWIYGIVVVILLVLMGVLTWLRASSRI